MQLQHTATIGTGNQVLVPRKLYEKLGLRRGEYLKVEQHGRELTLKPEDLERKEILEIVARGRADYKAGKSLGPFDTWEEMVVALHKAAAKIRKEHKRKPTM